MKWTDDSSIPTQHQNENHQSGPHVEAPDFSKKDAVRQGRRIKNSGSLGAAFQKTPVKIAAVLFVTLVEFLMFQAVDSTAPIIGQSAKKEILIAAHDLTEGQLINKDDVLAKKIVQTDFCPMCLQVKDFQTYNSFPVRLNLKSGSPLTTDLFLSEFERDGLSTRIPPGMRLVTIDVSLGSFGKLVKPGTLVDVNAVMNLPEKGEVTGTLLESVEIVGIGEDFSLSKRAGQGGSGSSAISFYATPEQVKFVSFVKTKAQFSVALRNPGDKKKAEGSENMMTMNHFLENKQVRSAYENDLFRVLPGGAKKKNSLAGEKGKVQ